MPNNSCSAMGHARVCCFNCSQLTIMSRISQMSQISSDGKKVSSLKDCPLKVFFKCHCYCLCLCLCCCFFVGQVTFLCKKKSNFASFQWRIGKNRSRAEVCTGGGRLQQTIPDLLCGEMFKTKKKKK